MPNYRAWKALIAAEYNNVKIDVPAFEFGKDNRTPEFVAKNPLGKVPLLDTPQGPIFESNAIARYVARLRQDSDLFGTSFYESGQVEQWLDFASNELDSPRALWLYPIFGFMQYDQEEYKRAKSEMTKVLTVLDNHLATRTYLVGHKITLADIVVVSALVDLYRLVFTAEYRAPHVNLTRWFTTCINQPQFAKVIGRVEFCTEEKLAANAGKKQDNKKQDNKPQEKKQDNKKDNKQQQQQKPKEEKQAEAAAPAAGGDDDEDKPKKKPKNPLDLLPPSAMTLDATKKLFFEKRPDFAAFFTEFWNFFDKEGYCIYKSEYQYNDDNRVLFMTSNLVSGWTQRLEELGRYAFGSVVVLAKDEQTPPYVVNGVWIFRGTDVPAEMTSCPDTEYHKLTRLDSTNAQHRKVVENYFYSDKLEGLTVLDRRYFK